MKSTSAMCRNLRGGLTMTHSTSRHQAGFAIVSAIFLLVVLAALGAFMVTFSTVQHTTSAQDLQGTRAYHAARAGAEWGVYQVVQTTPASCAGTASVPLGGTLAGFAVNVQCAAAGPFNEGGVQSSVYTITSTATSGTVGTPTYIERQVQVTVQR